MEPMKKLTLEETYKYLLLWRESKDKDALTTLVTGNAGLIHFFVKRYIGKGLTYEELLSSGNEALITAINLFNYKENNINCFSTYISNAIENEIKKEIKKYRKHSHVLSFNQALGKNRNGDELLIENVIGTDSDDLIESIIHKFRLDIVRELLNCLTLREKQIILYRFGLDNTIKKTQEEIASIFGCSRRTIINQENKALLKMRHSKNAREIRTFIE